MWFDWHHKTVFGFAQFQRYASVANTNYNTDYAKTSIVIPSRE